MKTAKQDTQSTVNTLLANQGKVFTLTNNILKSWNCTAVQIQHILQMGKSSYHKAINAPDTVRLSQDQLTRASLIANIYSACAVLFDNPENRANFMSMKNDNGFFHGEAPLTLIATGDFITLYETFKHIDSLRGGQW
jgi:uncharacterized protein (DUF2384 family)